jgi:hypothetical protein|tara:strand:- start:954 stop:1427 length:474 start_codon:yes stop_codon:yes gene_type:complete
MNKTLILSLMVISCLPFINTIDVWGNHLEGSMITDAECSEIMGRDCNCWELGNCSFTSDPLGTMLLPYDQSLKGMAMIIFWAMIIGLLWLRTESPQLVGIVGIAMSASYMAYVEQNALVELAAGWEEARIVGITLLVVSFGIAFYQMIVARIVSGPT